MLGTKWQDYDRMFMKLDDRPMNNNTPYFWLKEFCEANDFRLLCLTFTKVKPTMDSVKLYKGQVKNRSRYGIKKELRNGDLTSFLSLMSGDPYGN